VETWRLVLGARAANQIARDIVAPEKQTASFVVFVIQ
jgi:hypothetical protein